MNSLLKLSILILILGIISCSKDDTAISTSTNSYSGKIAEDWMEQTLSMVKSTPGFSPPVTARALGYISLTMYEAGVHGISGANSMQGQVQGLSESALPNPENATYHWSAVINAATKEIAMACFGVAKPVNIETINATYQKWYDTHKGTVEQEVLDRSDAYGTTIGKLMAAYAATDNQVNCFASNFPTTYTAPVGPGLWIPTGAQMVPLQPFWGGVRTFAEENATVEPIAPPTFSTDATSPFYIEAREVQEAIKNITSAQLDVAKYWADDPGTTATPPGHSMYIAINILKSQNANLAKSIEAYAKIGMGVHDAFVSCWKSKYKYNLQRPVTYINQNIEPTWKTTIATPPFPEYTSGHSVQSGAAAAILESLFGRDFAFVDVTHASRKDINGKPRPFANFEAFVQEAAISRLYGGIHYKSGIVNGITQGREIGKNIVAFNW